MIRILIFSLVIMLLSCNPSTKKSQLDKESTSEILSLFVGTYTQNSESEGIYLLNFNTETGELKQAGITNFSENPSYLAIHPNGKWIYAVNETSEDSILGAGRITAFIIDSTTMQLKELNSVTSFGSYPCHISIDASGENCYVANYGGGNVACYRIKSNGELKEPGDHVNHAGSGPHPNQNAPHAHMIVPNKNNQLIYANDLGTDKVYIYKVDSTRNSMVSTNNNFTLAPGTGPRHLVFHPQMPWVYILGELNGTITFCKVDEETGYLSQFQTVNTFDTTQSGEPKSADIHIHPNGKYLYASNRGDFNNIAIYSINAQNGKLSYIESHSTKGSAPRNFVIDPTGNFLLVANQDSDNIVVFSIDKNSGLLIDANKEIYIPKPVCLKFYK